MTEKDREKVRQEIKGGGISPISRAIGVFLLGTDHMLLNKQAKATSVDTARQDIAQTLTGNLDADLRGNERLLAALWKALGFGQRDREGDETSRI
jgi:hypothetical protein